MPGSKTNTRFKLEDFIVRDLDPSLSKEERKAILKEKLLNNILLIQRACPDFVMTDDEIEEFLSDERIENHLRALERIKTRERIFSEHEGYDRIPLAFARTWCFDTVTDDTPEARLERDKYFNLLISRTPLSVEQNKRTTLNRINMMRVWDPAFIDTKKSFDERVSLAIDDYNISEIAFESETLSVTMKQQIGMDIKPALGEEFKRIWHRATDFSMEGSGLVRFAASDLFLTFPVEKLTPDQASAFLGIVPSFSESLGLGRKDTQMFMDAAGLVTLIQERNPLAPSRHEFTMDDFRHADLIKKYEKDREGFPTVDGALESLTELSKILKENDHWYNLRNSNEYKVLNKKLKTVIDMLKEVDGPFETYPEKLKEAFTELSTAASNYNAHVGKKGKNETQQNRLDASKEVLNISKVISAQFMTFVDNHNNKDVRAFYKEDTRGVTMDDILERTGRDDLTAPSSPIIDYLNLEIKKQRQVLLGSISIGKEKYVDNYIQSQFAYILACETMKNLYGTKNVDLETVKAERDKLEKEYAESPVLRSILSDPSVSRDELITYLTPIGQKKLQDKFNAALLRGEVDKAKKQEAEEADTPEKTVSVASTSKSEASRETYEIEEVSLVDGDDWEVIPLD